MRGCAIPDQQEALTCAGVLFGELREKQLHAPGVESRQHEPERAPCGWMSRRIEPEPFVARINFGQWSLSNWCPDATKYRLESKARFVLAPDFHFVRRRRLVQSLRLKF